MFDYNHYVPVLRWKRAEQRALRELFARDWRCITPLLELVPSNTVDEHLWRRVALPGGLIDAAEGIMASWGGRSHFVDLGLLATDRVATGDRHPLDLFLSEARSLGLRSIPVTGLARTRAYQNAVICALRIEAKGICIRLGNDDLQRPDFTAALHGLLSFFNLKPQSIDLLVDFQIVSGDCSDCAKLCHQIPEIDRWRSFTIVSGSFPKDLSGYPPGQHLLPRTEWRWWRDQVDGAACLPRNPSFGDYTIQHPVFREPPEGANPSASIRYTTEDDWVLMRGEGIRNENGPGSAQWPANAQLLCKRREYCGSDFSSGDRYICEKSQLSAKPGSPETWLRAGINHHLTFVAHQINRIVDVVADVELASEADLDSVAAT